MKADRIKDIINSDLKKYYKSIVIEGSWGIGKSYYIRQAINNENYVYISLFGKNSIDELKIELYYKISYGITGITNKLYDLAQNNITLGVFGVGLALPKLPKNVKKKLNGDNIERIIIFDDLERKGCSLNVESVLGLIEELSNLENIKIILVANEDKIINNEHTTFGENEVKIYKNFQEKIIDKVFHITDYSNNAIANIFSKEKVNKYIELENLNEIVTDFYKRHNIKNLRTVQKGLLSLNIIFEEFDKAFLDSVDKLDIMEIIIIILSVATEEIEKLYYKDAEKLISKNESKDTICGIIFSEIDEEYTMSICGRVQQFYLNEGNSLNLKSEIIRNIFNIYSENRLEESLQELKLLYKKNGNEREIVPYYLSEKQFIDFILQFKNESIDTFSEMYNLNSYIKRLEEIYRANEFFEINMDLDEENIKNRIDNYITKFDFDNSPQEILTSVIVIKGEYCNEVIRLVEYARNRYEKISYKKNIEQMRLTVREKSYKLNIIISLYKYLKNTRNNNLQSIINDFIDNKFFIVSLSEEVSHEIWCWNHNIFDIIVKLDSNYYDDFRKKFIEFIQREIEQATIVGRNRLLFLVKEYKLEIGGM